MKYLLSLIFAICTYSVTAQTTLSKDLYYYDISDKLNQLKVFTLYTDKITDKVHENIDIDKILNYFKEDLKSKKGVFEINAEDIHKITSHRKDKQQKRKIIQSISPRNGQNTQYKVIGTNYMNPEKLVIYYKLKEDAYDGIVYKSFSKNNGISWTSPEIAIKHNLLELEGWDIIEPTSRVKKYGLIQILTDSYNDIYFSQSFDNGINWSYPRNVYRGIYGSNIYSSVYRNNVAAIMKCEKSMNFVQKGDVLVWLGKLKNILKSQKKGTLLKIAENYDNNSFWSLTHNNKKEIIILHYSIENGRDKIVCYMVKK